MGTADVIPLPQKPPHPGDLVKVIRRLAKDGAVGFSEHADQRGLERGIDLPDTLHVLKTGMIKGEIVPGVNPGEWKCKVVGEAEDSSRWIGVATIVVGTRQLYIVTVQWEDK
jgi:hypothetical protein